MSATNERLKKLEDLSYTWHGMVEKYLNEKYERSCFIFNGEKWDQDRFFLLSIRTWSFKYKLTPEEIIDVLIDYWGRKSWARRNYRAKFKSLGVKMPVFCGDFSENLIQQYVKRKYKNGENFDGWKDTLQRRYLVRHEMKAFSNMTTKGFVKDYRNHVMSIRKSIDASLDKEEFTKRRYPGNPWL